MEDKYYNLPSTKHSHQSGIFKSGFNIHMSGIFKSGFNFKDSAPLILNMGVVSHQKSSNSCS